MRKWNMIIRKKIICKDESMMASDQFSSITYSQQTSAILSSIQATSTSTSTETLQNKTTTITSFMSEISTEQSFKNVQTSTKTSTSFFAEITTNEQTRVDLSSKPSSLSRPQDDLPLLHIEGSIQTKQIYNEDFKSKNNLRYKNFKNNIELEMEWLLKSISQIETAKVSVIDIKNADPDFQRSTSASAAVYFVSICSFRSQTKTLTETMKLMELSIIMSLKNADPSIYILLSNATITISVGEPRIIEIESSSKAEISEKIGAVQKISSLKCSISNTWFNTSYFLFCV